MLRAKRLERLLGDVLHVGVERQHHVHPVARLHVAHAERHHLVATAVGLGLAPTAHSLKLRVEHPLDAVFPLEADHRHARILRVAHADKSGHVRGEVAAGINAQLRIDLLAEHGAPDVVIVQPLLAGQRLYIDTELDVRQRVGDALPVFEQHLSRKHDVLVLALAAFGVGVHAALHALGQVSGISAEKRRDRPGHEPLVATHQRRVGAHRLGDPARRQHRAPDVQNIAAPRGVNHPAAGVVQRVRCMLVVLKHLNIHQPHPESHITGRYE